MGFRVFPAPGGVALVVAASQSDRRAYASFAPLLVEFAALPADDPTRERLRDKLVAGHLPVVRHIARRFAGRGEPLDDLEQAGTIGLIGAVDRFDPHRGIDFLSFAIPTITGEIRRHFRDHTWSTRVPRRLKDLQTQLAGVTGELAQELGRAPRPSEIATRLGLPIEEVLAGLEAQHAYRSSSLEELSVATDTPLADRMGSADVELDDIEYREALHPLLDELSERDRTILVLRFFGNRTQTQIAEVVGISQMHVSRLLAQILTDLRRRMSATE